MSVEILHKAAIALRVDSSVNHQRGHMPMRVVRTNLAVADWLDAEAQKWHQCFTVTQEPSRGVDQPAGVHYDDPEAAARGADFHTRHALAVATAYLGVAAD